jgi:hypothetical protein
VKSPHDIFAEARAHCERMGRLLFLPLGVQLVALFTCNHPGILTGAIVISAWVGALPLMLRHYLRAQATLKRL